MSSNNNSESFEEAKRQFFDRIWKAIPKKLRIPVIIVVLMIPVLTATQSHWKKLIFDRPPPERCIIRGYITNGEEPVAMPIQLKTEDANQNKHSDNSGLVVFNVIKNEKVLSVKYSYMGEQINLAVDDTQLKSSNEFYLELQSKNLSYND